MVQDGEQNNVAVLNGVCRAGVLVTTKGLQDMQWDCKLCLYKVFKIGRLDFPVSRTIKKGGGYIHVANLSQWRAHKRQHKLVVSGLGC